MGWVNVPEAYEDEEDSMLINESIQLLRSLSKEKKREVYHLIKDISSK